MKPGRLVLGLAFLVACHGSSTNPKDANAGTDAITGISDSEPNAPVDALTKTRDSQTTSDALSSDTADAERADTPASDNSTPKAPDDAATKARDSQPTSDAFSADAASFETSDSASSEGTDTSATEPDDSGLPITTADIAYMAVWASGPNDVWVGGKGGQAGSPLRHWDGSTWTDSSAFSSDCLVQEIWGASPISVWAVGCTKTIMHWDGTSWRQQSTPAQDLLLALRGSADDDVWAGGWGGLLVHWDGQAWAVVSSGTSKVVDRFWINSRSDAWLVAGSGSSTEVRRWDGKSWAAASSVDIGVGQEPTSIFALTGDDIWLSSWDGLYHFDGSNWGLPPAGKDLARETVFALWGNSAKQIYAASSQAWRYDGNGWTLVPTKPGTVRGVWGIPSGQAWFVGDNGYLGTYQP